MWVLKKRWHPRRFHNVKGYVQNHFQMAIHFSELLLHGHLSYGYVCSEVPWVYKQSYWASNNIADQFLCPLLIMVSHSSVFECLISRKLWAHLNRIRKADLSHRDPVGTKKTPAFCSRPPVFLQRYDIWAFCYFMLFLCFGGEFF